MRIISRHSVVVLVLISFFSTALVIAQEATAPPTSTGTIVCDSDLLLSLSTAENFFGFNQIRGLITNADPALMADVSTLDRGQYTPLLTANSNPLPIISMSQEQMQGIADFMQADAANMQAQMTSMLPAGTDLTTMTALNAAPIAGEDPTCTTLRAELNRFYTILNFQHLSNIAGDAGMTSTGNTANMTGTPATPVSAIGGSNSSGSSISGNGGAPSGNIPGTGAQLTPPPGGSSPGG